MTDEISMSDELKEYRKHILLAQEKAQDNYDKTIISLSGGALGISFAFISNIIKPDEICSSGLLFWSWVCWGLSISSILFSYLLSHFALRKTLKQVDDNSLYENHVGGIYDYLTLILNISGGVLFFVGVILISIFVKTNL